MSKVTQYCTFYVADHHFGLDVAWIQEVLSAVATTNVPLTTPVVSGLINLRGQIVLAIDLRARLGLDSRDDDCQEVNLILQTADGLVCLQADRLGDVLTTGSTDEDITDIHPLPATVSPSMKELVKSVVKLDDSLLLILEIQNVLACELCTETDTTSVQ